MILRKLEVENFRQLPRVSTVEFVSHGAKNVTVILGENGSGKSTLLLAIQWCLYGQKALTHFEAQNPTALLNHTTAKSLDEGDKAQVAVTLIYEHGPELFRVKRWMGYTKISAAVEPDTAESIVSIGKKRLGSNEDDWDESDKVRATLDTIERSLPFSLCPYFFFAGESASAMVDPRNADELTKAVKVALDIELLERAQKHAKQAYSEVARELKNSATGDLQDVSSQVAQLEADRDGLIEELATKKKERESCKRLIEEQESIMAKYQQFEKTIGQKRQKETELNSLNTQLSTAKTELREEIRHHAYLGFLEPVSTRLAQMLVDAYQRDNLPARIKPSFIGELLEKGTCLCGSDVTEGTEGSKRLRQELENSGLDEVSEQLQALDGRLKSKVTELSKHRERYQRQEKRIKELGDEAADVRAELERLETELQGVDVEEDALGQAMKRRTNATEDRDNLSGEISDLTFDLGEDKATRHPQSIGSKLAILKETEKTLSQTNQRARVLSARKDELEQLETNVGLMVNGMLTIVQQYLHSKVHEVYKEVAILERRLSFTSDFRLVMEEWNGDRYVPSVTSGANSSVLALCFVASFIELAKNIKNDQAGDKLAIAKANYPMVMDAPFAKMGEHFSGKVPDYLCKAVPQLVIMSSYKQWKDDVEESLKDYVGKAFVLNLHTNAGETRRVPFLGREVPYVTRDDQANPDYSILEAISL